MRNAGLFALASVIWGSTWFVITYQLGVVAPEASVAYRFAIAAAMLALWCLVTGRSLRFPFAQHRILALQGVLLFGMNYVLVYLAEQHIPSGLVAVLFSLIVFFNLAGVRVLFAAPVSARTLAGSVLGVAGVAMLFWPQLAVTGAHAMLGIAYGLGATLLASGGNLIAVRNQRSRLPVLPATAWGMGYGAAAVAAVALLQGVEWTFDPRIGYVASLLYLAAFGSVIAFVAYLVLLGSIGAARAGYVGVAVPLLALLMSTLFENFHWHAQAVTGAAMCIAGNVLVLMPERQSAAAARDG